MRHLLVLTLTLLLPSTALAVTGGTPDENRHPNVGALVADIPGRGPTVVCSGTLIASTVFLTAGHCTAGLAGRVWVTFDAVLARSTWALLQGRAVTHPEFGRDAADPADLGVVVLDRAVAGISPARLANGPAARGSSVENVGYGYVDRVTGDGRPAFLYDGVRRTSTSTITSVTRALVRTDDGVCFGDSGGPRFAGSEIVAVTSSGDGACAGMSTGYRVDTPAARTFLARFVQLR